MSKSDLFFGILLWYNIISGKIEGSWVVEYKREFWGEKNV